MNDIRDTRGSPFVPMATRLERNIERGASRAIACLPEGENFGMWKAGAQMKTLPDDSPLCDNHSADHRIRTGRPPALRSKAKGQSHVAEILCAAGHRFLRAIRDRLRPFRADAVDAALFLEPPSAKAA